MKPNLIAECDFIEDPPKDGYRMGHAGAKHFWLQVGRKRYPITEAEAELWHERLAL